MRFRIVFHITIFSKIISFSEKITEKTFFFVSGRDIDISIFSVKTIDNAIETIDNTVETIDEFAKTIDSKYC